jgi:demethylmenaquinone methyltransferase/2-methoxy-6-polyprenyl-1,4-benzoquinol methylase
MFDRIAPRYDLLNRLLSLGADRGWRKRAVSQAYLGPGERGLDVGVGTGDLALGVLRASAGGSRVAGIDISPAMLAIAARRAADAGLAQRFHGVLATAEALPFADETFHRAAAAFTVRNVGRLDDALREIRRVLRSNGRVVILELHTPSAPLPRALYRGYGRAFPALAGALGSDVEAYRYLPRSIESFADPDELRARLVEAGFRDARYERLTFGVAAIHLAEA